VLDNLQIGMGPGVIVSQEKGYLLLWPDSASLSLQLMMHQSELMACWVAGNPER